MSTCATAPPNVKLSGGSQVASTNAVSQAFRFAISLIQEGHDKRVRMGHLAFVGSHKTNGVSALHTDLMGQTVFRYLNRATPERIVNMTNGISFRRWLFEANPNLTTLLTRTLGEQVLDDPNELTGLERFADDPNFVQHYAATKHDYKKAKLYIAHGADDPFVPPPEVAAFQDEMRKAGADYEIVSYGGAVHGFSNPGAGNDPSRGAAYQKEADQRSWRAMRDFLGEVFGK